MNTRKGFVLISFIFFSHTIIFSQNKLSPKFNISSDRLGDEELLFSVSYTDSLAFKKKYDSKIIVYHNYPLAKTVSIKTSYQLVTSEMAIDPNILFIDIIGRTHTEAGIDFSNAAFNRITKAHHFFPTLLGSTQRISIKEQSFDSTDIDLLNRNFTTSLTPSQLSQHATTMATLIAGAGNSSIQGIGVASASRITSSDFQNLLPDADEIFLGYDIHLQNHSYGVSIENYYGNEAAAYDQQINSHPTLVHVFSAGNLGNSTPASGTYQNLSFATLSGNFKQAKNVITVTAVDTSLLVNSLNSKGPAYDGRLKPELTAYGQNGTSEAAALVTGTCAILQENYLKNNGELPAAATIKAILIASATDIGTPGIDYTYGYGSLNTYNALQLINNHYTATYNLANNGQPTLSIPVPSSIAELRVVVTWTDPPAIQNASQALVNDIDATLSFGGIVYFPWVLNHQPNTDSLTAQAKRKKDHLNTVEYFTVSNPTAGSYLLTITAPQLTTSSQTVSVAYWLEKKNSFEWDYPTGSDQLKANTTYTLFWNQNFSLPGELLYQLDGGDWITIATISNTAQYFKWKTPNTFSSTRLKMKIGGSEYLSDQFMISPQPNMNVAFVCTDNFSLTWNSVRNADSYRIYRLGEQYLTNVLDTRDTSIVMNKDFNNSHFAVAPKRRDSVGLKSQTIDYTSQGSFCYINLFEAERYDKTQVRIQITLSTLINVDHIILYKILNNQQKIFARLDLLKMKESEWFDTELIGGVMSYQAEVVLTDGTSLKSDVNDVFIEIKNKAVLFPNPVVNSSEINILSEGVGAAIQILDVMGHLITKKELESNLETLNVLTFKPGLYIYQLEKNGKVIDAGKFMKL